MVQGRKLEVGGIWDHIKVELGAVVQVLRPHDIREKKKLAFNRQVIDLLAPVIETHGTATQRRLVRALAVNAVEMQRENVVEDLEHESVFSVAGEVA